MIHDAKGLSRSSHGLAPLVFKSKARRLCDTIAVTAFGAVKLCSMAWDTSIVLVVAAAAVAKGTHLFAGWLAGWLGGWLAATSTNYNLTD